MYQDWSRLIMNKENKYTGVMFAAINKRANLVAQLTLECRRSDATKTITEKAKAQGETVVHPYLDVIDRSLNFSNYQFWLNARLSSTVMTSHLRPTPESRSSSPLGGRGNPKTRSN
jgi:hypothetical protein